MQHIVEECVRLENDGLERALAALRDALPRRPGFAPVPLEPVKQALHGLGALLEDRSALPGRRLLLSCLAVLGALPRRVALRLGDPRGEGERFQELVRGLLAAEVLGDAAWDDFVLRSHLFVEWHLARMQVVEQQLQAFAALRARGDGPVARLRSPAAACRRRTPQAGGHDAVARPAASRAAMPVTRIAA